jgi:hypothetical protein
MVFNRNGETLYPIESTPLGHDIMVRSINRKIGYIAKSTMKKVLGNKY